MRKLANRTAVHAVAATAVLALALTACGEDGKDDKSSGAAADTSKTASAPAKPGQEDGTEGSGDAKGDAGVESAKGSGAGTSAAKSTGAAKSSTGSAAVAACTTKDVKITTAAQDGPPVTHMLLTAKNTSSRKCELKGYPLVHLQEGQGELAPVAKSKPPVPVVLNPGAPAYALVKMSDGGMDEDVEPVLGFSVSLQGNGGMAILKAPGAGYAVDGKKAVTGYWTYELANGRDDF
ncbi:DUF4232 domain-containing protein [Streptomyces palmae]|uniref:DUF4232 domain-containing protein n=1 Tax=Streptomyces palmae TaxID=1701085 RepID=A0A4Z0FYG8_9ACTN|nr:DUF4232 domain-containing protein [Streptomyces palmae]TGA87464.1 DUF4232 domain-containing protein [Streptomyces palmae]